MELRHLRYFVAAAEEEHFGRASERLHITRPAVSQIVSDLEGELGVVLFERLAHRVRLTAAGRALLPELQRIMDDLNRAFALAQRVGEGKTGALNIGYGSVTLLHPLFRAAVKSFHEQCPDVTLSLLEIASSEQPKALAQGRIHAGFMHVGPHDGSRRRNAGTSSAQGETLLDRFRIQTGRLGVVMSKDHPLAGRQALSMEDLAGERFVSVRRTSISPPLQSLCQEAGFEPNIVQEVNSVATLLNLVSVGMGVGLAVTGKGFSYPPSLAVVPLSGVTHPITFELGWIRDNGESVLHRFIKVVQGLAQE